MTVAVSQPICCKGEHLVNTRDKRCQRCNEPCGEYPKKRGYLFDDQQGRAHGGMLWVCKQCWVRATEAEINDAAYAAWKAEQTQGGK